MKFVLVETVSIIGDFGTMMRLSHRLVILTPPFELVGTKLLGSNNQLTHQSE